MISLPLTGCSGIAGLPGPGDDDITGSISRSASVLPGPGELDAPQASEALDKALDPRMAGMPIEWTNAESGRSGSFVAAGEAYIRDDKLCRGFTGTLITGEERALLRGAACRVGAGPWSIAKIRPWNGAI